MGLFSEAIASSKPGPASKKEPKPEAKVEEVKEVAPAKDEEMVEAPAEKEETAEKEEPAKEEVAEKKDEPMEEINTPAVAAEAEDEEESDDEEESGLQNSMTFLYDLNLNY